MILEVGLGHNAGEKNLFKKLILSLPIVAQGSDVAQWSLVFVYDDNQIKAFFNKIENTCLY